MISSAQRLLASTFAVLAALGAAACSSSSGTIATRGELVVGERQLDFGDVPVLNTHTLKLEVTNVGRAPIQFSRVAILETGTPFAVGAAPEAISAGETQDVEVTFQPPALDSFAATLRLESDDPDSPSVDVTLAGRGFTAAAMELPAALDFGTLCEASDATRKLVIHSSGTADLVLEQIRFADGTSPDFTFLSSTRTPATVPMGGDLTLDVRFAPKVGAASPVTGAVEIVSTDPQHRTATVPLTAAVNRVPLAAIKDVLGSAPGATVTLDGTDSTDPDGNLPLTYTWSLRSAPLGSRAKPAPADASMPTMQLDLPGPYSVQLKVRDAAGCVSAPALKDVLAKPAQQMMVEVVWDNIDADLDLHMVPEGQPFFGPLDCYYADGHMHPDWGATGSASDDPSLDRDALTGYGPEIIGYAAPAPGRYTILVHYFSDHRSATPATEATVRLYLFGVVRAEMRRTLSAEGQRWTVLSVDWPAATSTSIDTLE